MLAFFIATLSNFLNLHITINIRKLLQPLHQVR